MPDHRDLTNAPPSTNVWLGKIQGQWPIYAFTSEGQAATWLEASDNGRNGVRRVWKVTELTLLEVELTPPAAPRLRMVEVDG